MRFKRLPDGRYSDGSGSPMCGCPVCLKRCADRLEMSRSSLSLIGTGDIADAEGTRMIIDEYEARVANMILGGRTCS